MELRHWMGIAALLLLIQLAHSGLCGNQKKVPSTTSREFIMDALAETNQRRLEHGVPPLKLNEELCEMSQSWANTQALTKKWDHSNVGRCGENLFLGAGKGYKGSKVVFDWYREEKMYDYKKAKHVKGTGHFTTMIWKGTKEMCISEARAPDGYLIYVVANYFPGGNIQGLYKKNVLPKLLEARSRKANGTAVAMDSSDNKANNTTRSTAPTMALNLSLLLPAIYFLFT